MNTPAAVLVLLLAASFIARADNWIQNGDFSSGLDHWHGQAKTPADVAPSDPFAKPDPLLTQGAIFQLKSQDRIKIEQDFRTKSSTLYLTVTYKVSPDLAFSTNIDDYTNIPSHIDYGAYRAFNLKPGNWLIFFTDFGGDKGLIGTYTYIKPKVGSTDPQTFRDKITGLVPLEDKTLCIAFPPGTGTVVLLNVSLTDQPDDSSSPAPAPAQ